MFFSDHYAETIVFRCAQLVLESIVDDLFLGFGRFILQYTIKLFEWNVWMLLAPGVFTKDLSQRCRTGTHMSCRQCELLPSIDRRIRGLLHPFALGG